MSTPLDGKIVIVTGAARGIGAAYAQGLAMAGACLALCDLDVPRETADRLRDQGAPVLDMACDVADQASVTRFIRAVEDRFGAVDVLVNNAGLFANLGFKPLDEIDDAEWDRVMAVNVRGSFSCSRAVVPIMRRQGRGKIINIASGTVFKGVPYMLHYVASKGAVVSMTRAMARELGDSGITCNCLAPGLTMSEAVLSNADWQGEAVRGNIASRCLKREAIPADLTGALLFLAGPASDFMTGQTIVVDGGSVMH